MTEQSAFTPQPRPCWIAGAAADGAESRAVTHPYDGSEVAEVAVPSGEQVEAALSAAATAPRLSATERAAALERIAAAITMRAEEFAETITAESGKPWHWAQLEVEHAAAGYRLAAVEVRRGADEPAPLGGAAPVGDRLALTRRRARGPILAITSAAFPLNLVAHEVAAALAVGAPVIVKPASATPLSALLLGEVLSGAGLPAGMFSVLPLTGAQAQEWLADERIAVVSCTGTAATAAAVRSGRPQQRTLCATGMRSSAIVAPDWKSEADVDFAAAMVARYAGFQAGRSPLAVRRAVLHASVADACTERIVTEVAALRGGSPFDPEVVVGPLPDEAAAQSVVDNIEEALAAGARLLHGGKRDGSTVEPTVLADVPEDSVLCQEESAGPVLVLSTVDSLDAAFAELNRLGCRGPVGLFSHSVRGALSAGSELSCAGVTLGELAAHRAGELPFTGALGAGTGAALLRAAMRARSTEQITLLPLG